MSLNTNIKVPLPKSGWVLSKPNKAGKRYVKQFISSTRVSSKNVNVKRKIIGIYDEKTKMLIPNNNYYDVIKEEHLTIFAPSSIRNYGNYFLLYKISSNIGLLNTLKFVFPSSWDKILTIAMYNICEGDAMYYIDDYCDENYIINNTYVTSQETSTVFSKITEEKRQEFFKEWIKVRKDNECIAYDITSISSFSKGLTLLDYGYNRDDEKLPQVNMGMFYGMGSNLPLIYDVYNGSIGDKVHFESMMKYASSYDLKNASLIMDKGFFKKDNLTYLYKNTMPFIMGITLSLKEVSNLFMKHKDSIKDSKYLIKDCENDLTCGKSFDLNIDNQPFRLHLYYNYYKFADEVSIIQNKIKKLETELQNLTTVSNPKHYEKYFKLTLDKEELISYEKDYDKINNAHNCAGYFALLSSRMDNNAEEILHIYRKKDLVEKTFDNLKNYIDCNRLRVHCDETMRGKIFIIFISLILKSVIDTKIKDCTVKKIINETKKIKIQILANGEEYIAPLTKKQKDILSLFDTNENELKESIRQLPL